MAPSDQVKELLERSLSCARRIADLSIIEVLNNGSCWGEIRLCRRDLPHFNKLFTEVFQDKGILAADLRHEIVGLEEDALRLADWTEQSSQTIRQLQEAANKGEESHERYGQERDKTLQECQKLQQIVYQSLSRVQATANKTYAAADKAAQQPISAQPVVPAMRPESEQGQPKDSSVEETPVLSERQYEILEAMYNLKATDPARRKATEDIARAAEGAGVNPEVFKRPVADLVRRGFVATKGGRGGGCWLTATGRALAERILKR